MSNTETEAGDVSLHEANMFKLHEMDQPIISMAVDFINGVMNYINDHKDEYKAALEACSKSDTSDPDGSALVMKDLDKALLATIVVTFNDEIVPRISTLHQICKISGMIGKGWDYVFERYKNASAQVEKENKAVMN